MAEKPTTLAKVKKLPVKKTVDMDEAQMLISQAIDKNVPVETMEKLLSMRRELKKEKAKEEFDKAMANFQSQCPTIEKTKSVKTRAGIVAYKYAPIESIVSQVKKLLQENGFSYSTNMKMLPDGVGITVKVTHAAGHSEVTEMTVPLGTKTEIMSQTQVVAAASTFAKRYAFCNAFGILTGDEDTDAAPPIAPKAQVVQPQQPPVVTKTAPVSQKPVQPSQPPPAKVATQAEIDAKWDGTPDKPATQSQRTLIVTLVKTGKMTYKGDIEAFVKTVSFSKASEVIANYRKKIGK